MRTLPPPPSRAEEVTTERTFSFGQLLILLSGAVLLAIGIVAVVRGKLDGPLTEPVVQVMDFDHTPLLGVIEIGAGVLLLLTGLRSGGRMLAGLVGALMIVGGALILAELTWGVENLAAEQSFGWVPLGIGIVALLGAYAFPATTRGSPRSADARGRASPNAGVLRLIWPPGRPESGAGSQDGEQPGDTGRGSMTILILCTGNATRSVIAGAALEAPPRRRDDHGRHDVDRRPAHELADPRRVRGGRCRPRPPTAAARSCPRPRSGHRRRSAWPRSTWSGCAANIRPPPAPR